MARKSRKGVSPNASPISTSEFEIYRTALYIRLSVEDKKKRGDSIETQKNILENFIAIRPEFELYDIYIDNGTTGTNFDRPAFKRMISDVESGKVNCIIVKDLSRLGRNAIDTGFYIEKYFPKNKVRFIALGDDFDTASGATGGIILPLKNMINEAYAIDISRKIKSQARQSMNAGDFIGARPPYGYRKDPANCHRLLVDEVAAPVVRQIFQWAYARVGMNDIVRRLNESGIPTPSHYAASLGRIKHKNLLGNGKWQTYTLRKILSYEGYTGDMVQGKTKCVNHKQIPVSEDQWIVRENTHEAIISRELFQAVKTFRMQVAAESLAKEIIPYTENVFKGKIFCGCCGKSLHRQRNHEIYFFRCISNDRIAKGTCKGVSLKEAELCGTVRSLICKEVDVIVGKRLKLCKNMPFLKAKQIAVKAEMTAFKRTIESNRRFMRSLYENLAKGIITREEYTTMKVNYEAKIKSCMDGIKGREKDQSELKTQMERFSDLADNVENMDDHTILTTQLAEKLIERIEVSAKQEVTIKYRFENGLERVDEVCANA